MDAFPLNIHYDAQVMVEGNRLQMIYKVTFTLPSIAGYVPSTTVASTPRHSQQLPEWFVELYFDALRELLSTRPRNNYFEDGVLVYHSSRRNLLFPENATPDTPRQAYLWFRKRFPRRYSTRSGNYPPMSLERQREVLNDWAVNTMRSTRRAVVDALRNHFDFNEPTFQMYEDSRSYGPYGQDFNYTIRRDDPEGRSATVPAENFIQECPICFEPLENTITVRTPCGHGFHRECLRTWLNTNYECPICRAEIYLNVNHMAALIQVNDEFHFKLKF
jgi:hypothetical protein